MLVRPPDTGPGSSHGRCDGPGATEEQIAHVVERVEEAGGEAFVSRGVARTIIGLVGDIETFHGLNLRAMPGVADVMRVSAPYKLVSRQHHPHDRRSTSARAAPCRSARTPSR